MSASESEANMTAYGTQKRVEEYMAVAPNRLWGDQPASAAGA
jgi:hypothetical protein